jgi:hypothetical protein
MGYGDRKQALPRQSILYTLTGLCVGLFLFVMYGSAQDHSPTAPSGGSSELFHRVISNQKKNETELGGYEFTQRVEKRRTAADPDPFETKVWRVFPAGAGTNKIALSTDGSPLSAESYRNDLEKLEKYLAWVAQDGPAQKEAYAKTEHKRKERYDLIEATHQAFQFTFEGKESRGDRTLLRYTMTPNPDYKPTSRATTLFTKVRGTIWIDEESSQMAKVEGTVTDDVSLALLLAKVYKGSHFMEERYEIAPGVWEPTYDQYDFDGRKFWVPFSIHEKTVSTNYKRVGPPKESVELVRAELNKLREGQPSH